MNVRSYDLASVIAGLLFVALGAVFLLDRLEVWEARLSVVLPLVVIGLGVALLLGALLRDAGKPDE